MGAFHMIVAATEPDADLTAQLLARLPRSGSQGKHRACRCWMGRRSMLIQGRLCKFYYADGWNECL